MEDTNIDYLADVWLNGVCIGNHELNTLRVLEHIDVHPAADRLLPNLISVAAQASSAVPTALPSDFDALLDRISYR